MTQKDQQVEVTVRRGGETLRKVKFSEGFTIGRDATCDLQLPEQKVSRLHAVVELLGSACTVEDRSRNGCEIAGRAVPKEGPAPWVQGAVLRIHDFELQFRIAGGIGETRPAVAPPEPEAAPQPEAQPQPEAEPQPEPEPEPEPADPVHRAVAERIPTEQAWDGAEATFKVASIIRETSDVRTYRMMPSAPMVFSYKPGQFVGVTVEIDGEPVRRSYSISSSPSRPLAIDITVKRVPDGLVSNWMADHLEPGAEVRLKKPAGKFTCFDHPSEKLLFLAAGSGITPMMSMLRWLVDTSATTDVHLVYSVRTPSDVIFGRELSSIAERYDNVTVTIVVTGRSPEAKGWPGLCGRLDAGRLAVAVPDLEEREVFVCGPKPFSDATKGFMADMGIARERVHSESFGARPARAAAAPAATAASAPSTAAAPSPAAAPAPAAAPPPAAAPAPAPPVAQQPAPAPAAPPPAAESAPGPAADSAAESAADSTPGPAAAPEAAGFTARFLNSGTEVRVAPGQTLLEAAEEAGIDMDNSCREGQCGSCRTMKRSGSVRMEDNDLTEEELASGYIYACVSHPESDVELEA